MPRGPAAFESVNPEKKEHTIRVSEQDLSRIRDALVTRSEADVIAAHREFGMKKEKMMAAIRMIQETPSEPESGPRAPESVQPESGEEEIEEPVPLVRRQRERVLKAPKEPFLNTEEFQRVANALIDGEISEPQLLASPEAFGMDRAKMKKAIEMVHLREEYEEERARTDTSMVFSAEQLARVREELQVQDGSRQQVIRNAKELGMTPGQVRRALRVLEKPIINRPANPKAPDISPHLEKEMGKTIPAEGVPLYSERVLTAEDRKRLPEIKKVLLETRNAYPEYLSGRFGLDEDQAQRIWNYLVHQNFVVRGEDGKTRLFPNGVLGESIEAILPEGAEGVELEAPTPAPADTEPSWLVNPRRRGEKPLQIGPVEEDTPIPKSGTRKKGKAWKLVAPALVKLQEATFDPNDVDVPATPQKEDIEANLPDMQKRGRKKEASWRIPELEKEEKELSDMAEQLRETEKRAAELKGEDVTPDMDVSPTPIKPRRKKRQPREILKTQEEWEAEQLAAERAKQEAEEEKRTRIPQAARMAMPNQQSTHPKAPKPPSPWKEVPNEEVWVKAPPLPTDKPPAQNRDVPEPNNLPDVDVEDIEDRDEEERETKEVEETPEARQKRLDRIREQLDVLTQADHYAPEGAEFKQHREELDSKRHKAEALLAREDLQEEMDAAEEAVREVNAALKAAKEAVNAKEAIIQKEREKWAELTEDLDEKKEQQRRLQATPPSSRTQVMVAELALLNTQIPPLEKGVARQARIIRSHEGELQPLVEQRNAMYRERVDALERADKAESSLHSLDAYLASAAIAAVTLDAATSTTKEIARGREQQKIERAAAAALAENAPLQRGKRMMVNGTKTLGSGSWSVIKGTAAITGIVVGSGFWLFGKAIQFISNPLKALDKAWTSIKKAAVHAAENSGKTPRPQGG